MFEVNYVAVLVAGLASYAVGFLWYSDMLFGKAWRKYTGMKESDIEKGGMMKPMLLGFAGTLVMMFVFANVINLMGAVDFSEALTYAFWVWFGFIATAHFSSWVWSGKSFNLFLIESLNTLVGLMVAGAVLVMW